MFSNSMRESTQSKVELHGMEGDAVQLLIDFVYTHEISLSTANIFCVLCAANQLSFLQVIEVRAVEHASHTEFWIFSGYPPPPPPDARSIFFT